MNRITRNALAGALAAAVSLGAAAPAAFATPKATHTHVDHHRSTKAHTRADHRSAKGHTHVKHSRTDHRTALEQRWLAKRADIITKRLALATKRAATLSDETARTAVLLNISTDRTEVSAIKAAIGTTDAKTLASELRAYRPEVYNTIVADIRLATPLETRLNGLIAADTTTTTAAQLQPLADQVTAAVTTLSGYDATTSRAQLRAAKRVLNSVEAAFEAYLKSTQGDLAAGTPTAG